MAKELISSSVSWTQNGNRNLFRNKSGRPWAITVTSNDVLARGFNYTNVSSYTVPSPVWMALYDGYRDGVAQSFSNANAGIPLYGRFWLRRQGNPEGTIQAKIYTHSGTYGTSSVPNTLVATSNPIYVGEIGLSGEEIQFLFPTGSLDALTASTNYVLAVETNFTSSSATNRIDVGYTTSGGHSGNAAFHTDGGSWTAWAAYDAHFGYAARQTTAGTIGSGNPGSGDTIPRIPVASAIDSSDVIHIAYFYIDGKTTSVRYARFAARDGITNTWSEVDTVLVSDIGDAPTDSSLYIAVAVDQNDVPHVAFTEYPKISGANTYDLHYINKVGGSWNSEVTVRSEQGNDTKYIDIDIDSKGRPIIVEQDLTNTYLYAHYGNTNNATSFSSDLITSARYEPSVSIEPINGDLWLSYRSGSNVPILNTLAANKNWGGLASGTELNDGNGALGFGSGVNFDSDGTAYLGYAKTILLDPAYNTYDGSSWGGETTILETTVAAAYRHRRDSYFFINTHKGRVLGSAPANIVLPSTYGGFTITADTYSVGQSFTSTGVPIKRVRFLLSRSGTTSPLNGNMHAELYAHSGTYGTSSVPTGTALRTATKAAYAVNGDANVPAWVEFEFSSAFYPVLGTAYVIVLRYDDRDGIAPDLVYFYASSDLASGNLSNNTGGGWSAQTQDLCVQVLGPADVTIDGFDASWVEAGSLYYDTVEFTGGDVSGAATLSGSATVTAAGAGTSSGASSVSASATVTTAGAADAAGVSNVSASATLTAAGAGVNSGASSVSASATLTVNGTVEGGDVSGSAALSVSGSVTVSGTATAAAAISVSGSATLTASGAGVSSGASSVTGSATFTVSGAGAASGASSVSASATLTANGTVGGEVNGSATLTATASTTAAGSGAASGTVSVSASATMTSADELAALTTLIPNYVPAAAWSSLTEAITFNYGSSDWDEVNWGASPGNIVRVNDLYYFYYTGSQDTDGNGDSWRAVGLATSQDLKKWTKHPNNPLVEYTTTGFTEPEEGASNAIVMVEGTTWHMWYAASRYTGPSNVDVDIRYRTSTDGVTWTGDTLVYQISGQEFVTYGAFKNGSTYYLYIVGDLTGGWGDLGYISGTSPSSLGSYTLVDSTDTQGSTKALNELGDGSTLSVGLKRSGANNVLAWHTIAKASPGSLSSEIVNYTQGSTYNGVIYRNPDLRSHWVEILGDGPTGDFYIRFAGGTWATSRLEASGLASQTGAASVIGSASLTASGAGVSSGAAAVSASATVTANGTTTGEVSGSATLNATASATIAGSGVSSGSTSLNSTATVTVQGDAVLTGSGIATATAALTVVETATILGATNLPSSATLTAAGSGASLGATNLPSSATLTVVGTTSGEVAGSATLSATANVTAVGAGVSTGSSSISASAVVATQELASIAGQMAASASATLTAVSAADAQGQTSVTGTASLTASGSGVNSGTAALAADATLTASGTLSGEANGSASLTATASLTASGSGVSNGATTVTGSATLTAAGIATRYGAATLSATASAAASGAGASSGTVAVTGSATVTADGQIAGEATGSATLTATASATASGSGANSGSTAISASADITVQETAEIAGTASLGANGSLTASGSGISTGSSSVTGSATLTGAATTAAEGTAVLTGAASLTGSGSGVNSGTVSLLGDATLYAIGGAEGEAFGRADLLASASLTGAGSGVNNGSASVTASATVSAAGIATRYGDASLTADATVLATGAGVSNATVTLQGDALIVSTGSGASAGDAALLADGTLAVAGASNISGDANMLSNATVAASGAGTALGSTILTGLGTIYVQGIGALSGSAALTAAALLIVAGGLFVSSFELEEEVEISIDVEDRIEMGVEVFDTFEVAVDVFEDVLL